MSWVAEELKTVNLGDKRRNQRLIKIVEDLSAMPNASVTQAARDGAAVQGIYPTFRTHNCHKNGCGCKSGD